MCAYKYKQTSVAYDIKGNENISSTFEKKEKILGGYVHIDECGKQFCTSTFKHTCAEQEKTTSQIKEILESLNYDTKELGAIN